jgi:dynein regulatry complex protein 1
LTIDEESSKTGQSKELLQQEYWRKMANVIDEKSYRTWLAVYVGMEKYHTLLTQRWQVSEKIRATEQQNNELKSLLRQYMSAHVNDELQVPPTQIMLAQAGMIPE